MPFLWTGIHLIDVISEAAGGSDSSIQGPEKEQQFNREVNARRVSFLMILLIKMTNLYEGLTHLEHHSYLCVKYFSSSAYSPAN